MSKELDLTLDESYELLQKLPYRVSVFPLFNQLAGKLMYRCEYQIADSTHGGWCDSRAEAVRSLWMSFGLQALILEVRTLREQLEIATKVAKENDHSVGAMREKLEKALKIVKGLEVEQLVIQSVLRAERTASASAPDDSEDQEAAAAAAPGMELLNDQLLAALKPLRDNAIAREKAANEEVMPPLPTLNQRWRALGVLGVHLTQSGSRYILSDANYSHMYNSLEEALDLLEKDEDSFALQRAQQLVQQCDNMRVLLQKSQARADELGPCPHVHLQNLPAGRPAMNAPYRMDAPAAQEDRELTPRQLARLSRLADLMRELGYPPTVSEYADRLGISYTAARSTLLTLRARGCVILSPHVHRGISITSRGVAQLGRGKLSLPQPLRRKR